MKLEGVALWMGSVALGLVAMGCGDSTDGAGGGGNESPSGGNGNVCYSVDVNETNDGSTACGPSVCKGGEYCFSDVGICDPGCFSELNCPAHQYCDLAGSGANGVGLCRKPGKSQEKACSASNGSGHSSGDDCATRCKAKAAVCGAPAATAEQGCSELCPQLSEDQIDCLETSSCEVLEQLTEGKSACGITGD